MDDTATSAAGRAEPDAASGDALPPPLVILGPGRSFTTVAAGMIGQHPRMYGFPELNLGMADTVGAWLQATSGPMQGFQHGVLRAYAQLNHGEQTDAGVAEARAWLAANAAMPVTELLTLLRQAIRPRAMVEKSPYNVCDDAYIGRIGRQFPDARYLHIARHPWTACNSMISSAWYRAILQLGVAPSYDLRGPQPVFDPQVHWYDCHERITAFLQEIPPERKFFLRGEDLLSAPRERLAEICGWLGIDAGDAAVEAMLHPEASPYACRGPESAPWGADPSYQSSPELRPFSARPGHLDAPLPWRADGAGFAPQVVELAESFGYGDAGKSP